MRKPPVFELTDSPIRVILRRIGIDDHQAAKGLGIPVSVLRRYESQTQGIADESLLFLSSLLLLIDANVAHQASPREEQA